MFQELNNELQHSFHSGIIVSTYNKVSRKEDVQEYRKSQHDCFTVSPICKISLSHFQSLAVLSKDLCIKIHEMSIFVLSCELWK